jgi:hypothetical protein
MPEELKPTLRTESAPPPDGTEFLAAICLLFGLRYNEAQILLSLTTHGFRTKEQLGIGSTSTMSVTLHTLRKKLKPRGIEITNIKKIGYMIDTQTRDKIHRLLTEHDAGILSTRPKPNDESDLKSEA